MTAETLTVADAVAALRRYWATMNAALKAQQAVTNRAEVLARLAELEAALDSGRVVTDVLDEIKDVAACDEEYGHAAARRFLAHPGLRKGMACCFGLAFQLQEKVRVAERALEYDPRFAA
jgi:hypothetical protein